MTPSAILIAAGYVGIIVIWGWPGLLAAAAHIAVLLLFVKR